jgi:hypothetical protein
MVVFDGGGELGVWAAKRRGRRGGGGAEGVKMVHT